jgi:hypothetical protein
MHAARFFPLCGQVWQDGIGRFLFWLAFKPWTARELETAAALTPLAPWLSA